MMKQCVDRYLTGHKAPSDAFDAVAYN